MTHLVLLNLVFLIPATCGAAALVLLYRRIFATAAPPEPQGPDGGAKVPLPAAGPDDLARSA